MKRGGRKNKATKRGGRTTISPQPSDVENGVASGRVTPAIEPPKPIRRRVSKKNEAQRRITDFFGVRRSGRKTEKELIDLANKELHEKILEGATEHKLDIYQDPVKGRGIKTNVNFHKGDYVVEYKGKMIPYSTAKTTEDEYRQDDNIGSFMYFFQHGSKKWCVDATEETGYKGRLINHSVLHPNLKTKVVEFDGAVHLIFVALQDIGFGEELLYDYGDRTSEALNEHPWLYNS